MARIKSSSSAIRMNGAVVISLSLWDGQCDAGARAASVVGGEFDAPAVRGDDAVADGEAETCARACGLRRVERIEEVRAMLRRDAGACVGDLDHEFVAVGMRE